MQIYNSHLLNNKWRFWKAFLYGFIAALLSAIALSYIMNLTAQLANMIFTALYLLPGYLIPKAIHKAGGGIGKKYAYMGAGLTFFAILLSDMFLYASYGIVCEPQIWPMIIRSVITNWFQFQNMGILTLFFIGASIYLAYHESDITSRN